MGDQSVRMNTDEKGELLFQVVRYKPKAFRQQAPFVDHSGGSLRAYNVNRHPPRLYRLPRVLDADHVLVVEGEEDVEMSRVGIRCYLQPRWRLQQFGQMARRLHRGARRQTRSHSRR